MSDESGIVYIPEDKKVILVVDAKNTVWNGTNLADLSVRIKDKFTDKGYKISVSDLNKDPRRLTLTLEGVDEKDLEAIKEDLDGINKNFIPMPITSPDSEQVFAQTNKNTPTNLQTDEDIQKAQTNPDKQPNIKIYDPDVELSTAKRNANALDEALKDDGKISADELEKFFKTVAGKDGVIDRNELEGLAVNKRFQEAVKGLVGNIDTKDLKSMCDATVKLAQTTNVALHDNTKDAGRY